MNITCNSHRNERLLPYNGANIEFLAKNMRLPMNRVFDVLNVVDVSADELITFLIKERIKNRSRSRLQYTHHLYRN
ncbi:hypothetical protein SAMN06265348_113207 [Pedobacter westerhofensis]|uniref:Uncharacterized protein n=1 Tax=Pedobacter westerhofensis TaxID=425512 RepID=A0A521FL89_9SPHI|nr:hypothetical protein SAMN06265348_113207 [Pedobacter westerhofensis]